MKLFLVFIFCLLICYIHVTLSDSPPPKTKDKSSTKSPGSNPNKPKDKNKEFTKNAKNAAKTREKVKQKMNNADDHHSTTKSKKALNIRTPFDKVLEKLSNCAATSSVSPSVVEVMQENLKQLQTDAQYVPLFNAAPHTAAFIKKKNQDSTKFLSGLSQALTADWSNPVWKSWNEVETLFRPFKQQFVYTMMRFNCT